MTPSLNDLLDLAINKSIFTFPGIINQLFPRRLFNKIHALILVEKLNSRHTKQSLNLTVPFNIHLARHFQVRRQSGFDLLIHGSLADKTAIAFSDVDDLVILNPEFFTNYRVYVYSLRQLRKIAVLFQRFDITSHHGHWLVPFWRLTRYDQSQIPVTALRTSVSLTKPLHLSISPLRKSNYHLVLKNLVTETKTLLFALENHRLNLFTLKELVSNILLLPALASQTQGHDISKIESLRELPHGLSPDFRIAVNWASVIRLSWPMMPTFRFVNYFKWLTFILPDREIIAWLVKNISPKIDLPSQYLLSPINIKRLINYIDKLYALH